MTLRNRLKKLEAATPAEQERIVVRFMRPTPDADGMRRYDDGEVVEQAVLDLFDKGAKIVIRMGDTGELIPRGMP